MWTKQGRVTAKDCHGAIDKILRRYPGASIRSLDYKGITQGQEWWEYCIVLKEDAS